jgi:hypothetical protein
VLFPSKYFSKSFVMQFSRASRSEAERTQSVEFPLISSYALNLSEDNIDEVGFSRVSSSVYA